MAPTPVINLDAVLGIAGKAILNGKEITVDQLDGVDYQLVDQLRQGSLDVTVPQLYALARKVVRVDEVPDDELMALKRDKVLALLFFSGGVVEQVLGADPNGGSPAIPARRASKRTTRTGTS